MWWLFLQVASVVLTVAGAVLLLTGPVVLGAILLIAAQPMNVFIAIRRRRMWAGPAGSG